MGVCRMRRLSAVTGCAFAALMCAIAFAQDADDESRVITLDEIWAYKMPGAREIEEFSTLADMRRMGSVFESWYLRSERLKFKDLARYGFAVEGSDVVALRAALAAFASDEKPRREFSADDEITIVFFSEPSGGNYVRIEQVELEDDKVEIQYRLEPYMELALSTSFALVPLGQMPAGEYHVEMRQLPRDQKFIEMGYMEFDEDWSGGVLCKPFSFVVTKSRE
jgi:hypothetical protein